MSCKLQTMSLSSSISSINLNTSERCEIVTARLQDCGSCAHKMSAQSKCVTCVMVMCEQCLKKHRRGRVTYDHRIAHLYSNTRSPPPEDNIARSLPPEDSKVWSLSPQYSNARSLPSEDNNAWLLSPEDSHTWSLTPEDSNARSLTPGDTNTRSLTPEIDNARSLTPEVGNTRLLTPEADNARSLVPEVGTASSLTPAVVNASSLRLEVGNSKSMTSKVSDARSLSLPVEVGNTRSLSMEVCNAARSLPTEDSASSLLEQLIRQQPLLMCRTHEEICKLRCLTCSKSYCASCVLKDHYTHVIKYIHSNEYDEMRKKLARSIQHTSKVTQMSLHTYNREINEADRRCEQATRDVENQFSEFESVNRIQLVMAVRKIRLFFSQKKMENMKAKEFFERVHFRLAEFMIALNNNVPGNSKFIVENESMYKELQDIKEAAYTKLFPPNSNARFTLTLDPNECLDLVVFLVPDPPRFGASVNRNGRPIHGAENIIVVQPPIPRSRPIVVGNSGSEAGNLSRPYGICCNYVGHIIIADRSNHRIQIYDSTGKFLFKFGRNGSKHGEFNLPVGVCVSTDNDIFVSDKANHRIQKFRMDGTFILAFGKKGMDDGDFNFPWGVACNSNNQLVVADSRNHRIQLFGSCGQFITAFGHPGDDMCHHLDFPRDICFTPSGEILVTDFNLHRIIALDPTLKTYRVFMNEYDQPSCRSQETRRTVNGPNTNFVRQRPTENSRPLRFNIWGNNRDFELFEMPSTSNTMNVWQNEAGRRRQETGVRNTTQQCTCHSGMQTNTPVQFTRAQPNTSYSGADVRPRARKLQTLEQKNRKLLWRPQGIICDEQGNVIVADKKHHRVQIFDSEANLLFFLGGQDAGIEDGEFNSPSGVALTPNGKIVVVDSGNHRVQIFN